MRALSAVFSVPEARFGAIAFCNVGCRGRATPRCCAAQDGRTPLPGLQVSRRQALASVISQLAVGAVAATVAGAAVPTIDEYYGGQGAVKKTGSDIVSTQPKSGDVDPSDLVEVLEAMKDDLEGLGPMIKKEQWGDVLARVRGFPLNVLRSPSLGARSAEQLVSSLSLTKGQAAKILEAREEAEVVLRQLEDVAFSNRVPFFNLEDQRQVSELAKSSAPPVDLSEPLELLDTLMAMVRDLLALLAAGG